MELDRFAPTLGQNGASCATFAPNGMFHCINAVHAVLWLIRLTKFRLAQIITPVNNNEGTKSNHS